MKHADVHLPRQCRLMMLSLNVKKHTHNALTTRKVFEAEKVKRMDSTEVRHSGTEPATSSSIYREENWHTDIYWDLKDTLDKNNSWNHIGTRRGRRPRRRWIHDLEDWTGFNINTATERVRDRHQRTVGPVADLYRKYGQRWHMTWQQELDRPTVTFQESVGLQQFDSNPCVSNRHTLLLRNRMTVAYARVAVKLL